MQHLWHEALVFRRGKLIFFVVSAGLAVTASYEEAFFGEQQRASGLRRSPFPLQAFSEAEDANLSKFVPFEDASELPPLGAQLPPFSFKSKNSQTSGMPSEEAPTPFHDNPSNAPATAKPNLAFSFQKKQFQPVLEPKADSPAVAKVAEEGESRVSGQSPASATPSGFEEKSENRASFQYGRRPDAAAASTEECGFWCSLRGPTEFEWKGPDGFWEWLVFSTLLFFGGAVAASGGSGGGGLYLSLLLGFAHLPVHAAVPISKAMVFATAFTSATIYRGAGRGGEVDETWVNLVVPAALSGTLLGVYIHLRTPAELLLPLLLALMSLLCCRCLYTACRLYFKEVALRDAPAFEVIELPLPNAFLRSGVSRPGAEGAVGVGGEFFLQGMRRPLCAESSKLAGKSSSSALWEKMVRRSVGGAERSVDVEDTTESRGAASLFRREEALGRSANDASDAEPLSEEGSDSEAVRVVREGAVKTGSVGDWTMEDFQTQQETEEEEQVGPRESSDAEAEFACPISHAPRPLVVDLHLQDAAISDFAHITQFACVDGEAEVSSAASRSLELCSCCGLPNESSEGSSASNFSPGNLPCRKTLLHAITLRVRRFLSRSFGASRGSEGQATGTRCARCLFEGPALSETQFLSGADDFLLSEDEVPRAEDSCATLCSDVFGGRTRERDGTFSSPNQRTEGGRESFYAFCVEASFPASTAAGSESEASILRRVTIAWSYLQTQDPSKAAQHHLLVPLLLFNAACSLGLREAASLESLRAGVCVLAVAAVAAGLVQRNIVHRLLKEMQLRHAEASLHQERNSLPSPSSPPFKKVLRRAGRRFASFLRNFVSSACDWTAFLVRPARRRWERRSGEGREAPLLSNPMAHAGEGEVASVSASAPVTLEMSLCPKSGNEGEEGEREQSLKDGISGRGGTPLQEEDRCISEPSSESAPGAAAEKVATQLLLAPVVGLVAGTVAGMFGVGGGLIIGPLLLLLQGQGAAATASCCVVYTAGSTALQFLLQGRMLLVPATALAIVASLTATAGCSASLAIRRFCWGRKSFEAFAVAAALCTGTTVAARAYFMGEFAI